MNMVKNAAKSILIVEDDRDMQNMYEMFFSGLEDKYKINIEGSADIALQQVSSRHYDMVILDIIMEPLPGDTFFICTRSYKKTMFIPILVVSVLSPNSLENLKKINHVDFLQKPITKEQLLNKVEATIG